MRHGRAILCGAVILSGCAASRPVALPQPPRPRDPTPLTLSLLADVSTPGRVGVRCIRPGDELRTRDAVSFQVEVDRPAYLYLVWYSPVAWSTLLLGDESAGPVKPGAPVLVRHQGERIPLDAQTGEENIYAIASSRPLREVDPALFEELRILPPGQQRGGAAPPPPLPPPPKGLTPKERGRDLASEKEGCKLRVEANDRGVAALRLRFRHLP